MQTLQTSFRSLPLSSPLPGGCVLIVDDEGNVTDLLYRILTRLEPDLEVRVANSSTQALDLLNDIQFDLLITDYHMPRMNGLELAEAVRKRYPEVKVVLMTAYPSPRIDDLAGQSAVDGFLIKPFSNKDLREIVRQLLVASVALSPPPVGDSRDDSDDDGNA